MQQFGIRGVKPDSNVNLQNDLALLESKKDKCIEIFKMSSQIHELIKEARADTNMNPAYRGNLDATSMT